MVTRITQRSSRCSHAPRIFGLWFSVLGLTSLLVLAVSPVARGGQEEGVVHCWKLTPANVQTERIRPAARNLAGGIEGAVDFGAERPAGLKFDGKKNFVHLGDVSAAKLPTQAITVEAWVLIEKPMQWGGVVSALQDNGDFERGWLLGFRESKFCFAVSSESKRRLTYLTAPADFSTGDWYYVAGVYDGLSMRLFIDGKLAATSKQQSGAIVYPPSGVLGLGGYRDDNEFYPMEGRIAEAAIFPRALTAKEIRDRFERRKGGFPGVEAVPDPVAGWPTYMRDNSRSGISPERLELPLKLAWTYQARRAPQPAWPAPAKQNFWKEDFNLRARVIYDRAMHVTADKNSVYFGSSADDQVYCLDLETGRQRWSFFCEGPVRLAPTLSQGKVYVGSDDGCVYCLGASDGTLLWKRRAGPTDRRIPGNGRIISTWPVRSGVLVDGPHVRFAAGLFPEQGAYQYVLDAETGSEVAQGVLPFSPQGYLEKRGSSLLIARGRAPKTFLAKLKRAGKPISVDAGELTQRYPYAFIGAAHLRLAGGDGEVAAFSGANAAKVWSAPVKGKAYSLAVVSGRLLASTDAGMVYCFDLDDAAGKPASSDPPPGSPRRFPFPDEETEKRLGKLAQEVLAHNQADKGYCLALGSDEGGLPYEIARRTQLQVIGVESNPSKVAASRRALHEAGVYGRVSIVYHKKSSGPLPFGSRLFDLIVVAAPPKNAYRTPKQELIRLLCPGGLAILRTATDEWEVIRREPSPEAGQWTHIYADPANTACSQDQLVRGEFELQWFGRPGPRGMVDRHHRTAPPLFCSGRLFIPGDNRIFAVNAYNGAVLWQAEVSGSRRVGVMRDAGSMVASEDCLYVVAGNRCYGLDAATGLRKLQFAPPKTADGKTRDWGYIARVGDRLFGSTTKPGASRTGHSRKSIDETYYDFVPIVVSDSLFAMDRQSGRQHWRYQATMGAVVNPTITIGGQRLYFIESKNPATRTASSGRAPLPALVGQGAELVALDTRTGRVVFRREVPLREAQHHLYLAYAAEKLISVSTKNHAPPGKKPTVWYDVHCFDVNSGAVQWTATQNQGQSAGGSHGEQDHHPVIVGDTVYVEPLAYELANGRRLPNWSLHRGGHGCGTMSASASSCFFRADNPTICDLATGRKSKITRVSRPGCWINMIPAGGLLLIPEASSGCVCDFPIQASMAFAPKKRSK